MSELGRVCDVNRGANMDEFGSLFKALRFEPSQISNSSNVLSKTIKINKGFFKLFTAWLGRKTYIHVIQSLSEH